MQHKVVLDTNFLVHLLSSGSALHLDALKAARQISQTTEVYVPAVVILELIGLSSVNLELFFNCQEYLDLLNSEVVELNANAIAECRILRSKIKGKITPNDLCILATANSFHASLFTFDNKLRSLASGVGVKVC